MKEEHKSYNDRSLLKIKEHSMFCPHCGTSQSEELKFCKSCGVNLNAVRQAVTMGKTSEQFDWSKTWVTEMFLSQDERKIRKLEYERQQGITAEDKRHTEIKAGVITSFVGIGLMIFLYVFMNGIVSGGNISQSSQEIISRIWVAGVIPFFVGLGLLINGIVVSKKLIEISKRELQAKEKLMAGESIAKSKEVPSLSSANSYEPVSPKPSVTEHTTRQLGNSGQTQ
jgi:hypothetical protein